MLVRLSHLGDVVHALGIFHALRAAYPASEIAWVVQTEFAGLLTGLPGLTRLIRFDRRGGLRAWLRLRADMADFRPDWTIDAQGNTKSAAAAWLSRAARRAAPHSNDWQEPWAAWTANERAPSLREPKRHAMDRMEVLARAVAPHTSLPLRLDAALSEAEIERGKRELSGRSPVSAAPVLLHLSSEEDVRAWPARRWLELIRALRACSRGVLVLSGPGEASLGRRVAQEVGPDPGVTHWIGQRGLRELAALFHAAGERGMALVACDSGPMHLAAAHGLRVVALEGPQDAARTGPWNGAETSDGRREGPHRIVRRSRELDCAPCLRKRCRHPEGPVCMGEILAEDVLAALDRGTYASPLL